MRGDNGGWEEITQVGEAMARVKPAAGGGGGAWFPKPDPVRLADPKKVGRQTGETSW
jgi:hypothetical protein